MPVVLNILTVNDFGDGNLIINVFDAWEILDYNGLN